MALGRNTSATKPSPGRENHHPLGSVTPVWHLSVPGHSLTVTSVRSDGQVWHLRTPWAEPRRGALGSTRPQVIPAGAGEWQEVRGGANRRWIKSVMCSVLPAANNTAQVVGVPLAPPAPRRSSLRCGSRLAWSPSAQTKAATKGIRHRDWITVWPPVIPTL